MAPNGPPCVMRHSSLKHRPLRLTCLTLLLVRALLGPSGAADAGWLADPAVQRRLTEQVHGVILRDIWRSEPRLQKLLRACAMPHASDWLLTAPIPGLGLSIPVCPFVLL